RRHGQSTPWFAPKETPAASAAGWFLRVVPQTGAEPPAKVEKLLALFRRDAVGGPPGPKHRRPSDPDQRGIGVGNGELVHTPRFYFRMGLADDLILERDRQFIDIRTVIVKRERIAGRNQPAMLGLAQMQAAAIAVMQDAVI